MKTRQTYEASRLMRETPLILETGICTSTFTQESSVNTTGQQVDNKDYDTDLNPVCK